MHLWICLSEVAKEPPLAHGGTHVRFPSLMQTHEMWSEGRGEEGWSQRATRPPMLLRFWSLAPRRFSSVKHLNKQKARRSNTSLENILHSAGWTFVLLVSLDCLLPCFLWGLCAQFEGAEHTVKSQQPEWMLRLVAGGMRWWKIPGGVVNRLSAFSIRHGFLLTCSPVSKLLSHWRNFPLI